MSISISSIGVNSVGIEMLKEFLVENYHLIGIKELTQLLLDPRLRIRLAAKDALQELQERQWNHQ